MNYIPRASDDYLAGDQIVNYHRTQYAAMALPQLYPHIDLE